MAQTVIRGLREVNRAFAQVERNVRDDFIDQLVKAGEPIAATARSTIGRYRGAQTSTIKAARSGRSSAVVRQGARKRGGQHGDFGSLQMRHLIAARYEHEDDLNELIDDWLNATRRKAGF